MSALPLLQFIYFTRRQIRGIISSFHTGMRPLAATRRRVVVQIVVVVASLHVNRRTKWRRKAASTSD
jgi:hypothetical protein